ncbi:MAG: sterol desaturase family protein [Acidobacteria bacterium]|nr:sterol desaturase family protein [Acidobacteriota bacterium]
MENGLSEPVRLAVWLGMGMLLWGVESVFPLQARPSGRGRAYRVNLFLTGLTLTVNLLLAGGILWVLGQATRHQFGILQLVEGPGWVKALLGILGLDFFAYLAHVTMHKTSLGWSFHQVHHAETHVDVTTTLRQHPGETLVRIGFQLAGSLVFGVSFAVFTVYVTLSALNAQLEHVNFHLPEPIDRLVRSFWVTPNMHKLHHSSLEVHSHSNYANLFSFWDRLFGTFQPPVGLEKLTYGVVKPYPSLEFEPKEKLPDLMSNRGVWGLKRNAVAHPRIAALGEQEGYDVPPTKRIGQAWVKLHAIKNQE